MGNDWWDGDKAEVTVSVTRLVNVTFQVTYRLTAAHAEEVMRGDPCAVAPSRRPAPATVDWTEDGMSEEELSEADDAIKAALDALAESNPAFQAAVGGVHDG